MTTTIQVQRQIKPFGLHSKLYERPNPNGTGRQVVKESITRSTFDQLNKVEIYPDHSRMVLRNEYHAIQYPGTPVRIVMEYVEDALPWKNLTMPKEARKRLVNQLEGYVQQLHSLSDPHCRSFVGIPLFGLRFEDLHIPVQNYKYRPYDTDSPYVLCHGDLAWHNLLLDPVTFEIKCVLDWEYAGFYPIEAESEYWRREGVVGRTRLEDKCDIDGVLQALWSHRVEEEAREDTPQRSSIQLVNEGGKNTHGIEAELRKLLQGVHLGDLTPTAGTIFGVGLELGRKRIASGLKDIIRYFITEDELLREIFTLVITFGNGLPANKNPPIYQDKVPIQKLNNQLHDSFLTLANSFESSSSAFLPLYEHFSAEADITIQLEEMERLEALPGEIGYEDETKLREVSREMGGERRNLADQAFKEAESQKWIAIEEFATSLLRMSAAAKSVFPYLSDHDREQPIAYLDYDRAWTEYRALNISQDNGTGGCYVKIVDNGSVVALLKENFDKEWIGTKDERERNAARRIKLGERARNAHQKEDQKRIVEREKKRGVKLAE